MAKDCLVKHEFKKGQSGNPNGRPRALPELKDILKEILSEEVSGGKYTRLEDMIRVQAAKAAKGDIKAYTELLDRTFGKSNQAKNDDETDKEIKITIEHVKNPSKQ